MPDLSDACINYNEAYSILSRANFGEAGEGQICKVKRFIAESHKRGARDRAYAKKCDKLRWKAERDRDGLADRYQVLKENFDMLFANYAEAMLALDNGAKK